MKKLLLIYFLVLLGGFLSGWLVASYNAYLKYEDAPYHPTFWQTIRPY